MHSEDCTSVGLGETMVLGKQYHTRILSSKDPRDLLRCLVVWDPSGLAGMHLGLQNLDPQGERARGQETKAAGPCSTAVPSRSQGRAVFAHLQLSPLPCLWSYIHSPLAFSTSCFPGPLFADRFLELTRSLLLGTRFQT